MSDHDNTHSIVEMLFLHRALENTQSLKSSLGDSKYKAKFKQHSKRLDALSAEIKAEIFAIGKDLPTHDIQHFLFAATHTFHKKNPRAIFNRRFGG